MSEFEFTFKDADGYFDPSRTSILATEIDTWANECYGENYMVGGLLAFNDDMELVDIRVDAYGEFDTGTEVINTGTWEDAVAWMRSLGVRHLFGFVRRARNYGHGTEPGAWDLDMSETISALASYEDFIYQGFLIANGNEGRVYQHTMPAIDDFAEMLQRALLDLGLDEEPVGRTLVPEERPDVPPAFYQ